jgi:starvation-inducible outer membrane lipoprotein
VPTTALTAYTLPLKATYSYGATQSVAMFTAPIKEVAIRFEGVNTAENNEKVLVEVYRVAVDSAKELDLITDSNGRLSLEGEVLIDPAKPFDAQYGQFGRYVKL